MIRSRLYKNSGKDNDELRRRRIDQSVELRKVKKDEQLQKRRNIICDVDKTSSLKKAPFKIPEVLNYDKIILDMGSKDEKVRFAAVELCRKTLSRAKNPPINEFFQRGAIKLLVKSLYSQSEALVFESAWALTNIASGNSYHTQGIVESGASTKLIKLLSHKDIRVAEQCIWALGNIAGDGTSHRDMLIRAGVVDPALKLLERAWEMPSVVSNIAWMLSNLCRNKNPHPPRETIQKLLPVLKRLLEYTYSQAVVIDTTWAVSYASDSTIEFIDDILASGCVPILINLLGTNTHNLISPALRAIGNLVLGSDAQTQVIVDSGVLMYVPTLLNSDRPSIVKETCWMLSNITAGNPFQIQAAIDANLVPRVLELVLKEEFKIQREACWVISNMINGGSDEQREYLLNHKVLAALSKLLNVSDVRVLTLVLEAIRKLFETADQFGQLEKCCLELEACHGLDSLELLQDHSNEDVYKATYDLIAQYFNDEFEQSDTEAAVDDAENRKKDGSTNAEGDGEFHFVAQELQPGTTGFEF